MQSKTIVETAVAPEDFTTLVVAVNTTDLADMLSKKEHFMLCAPNK